MSDTNLPPLPTVEELKRLTAVAEAVAKGWTLAPGDFSLVLGALPSLLRAARELAELRAHGGPWPELDAARNENAELRVLLETVRDCATARMGSGLCGACRQKIDAALGAKGGEK